MLAADVTHMPDVVSDDQVALVGQGGNERITVAELAAGKAKSTSAGPGTGLSSPPLPEWRNR